MDKARNRIIVALDTSDEDRAIELINILNGHADYFKIGLEIIHAGLGFKITKAIHDAGGKIFYDAKLNDIPETTARAAKNISKNHDIKMFTVHANSGYRAMQEAVKNKWNTKVIAVTALTSLSFEECNEIFKDTPENVVISLAKNAYLAGCDGIVCSPSELLVLKDYDCFGKMFKITPGIKPDWYRINNDQKRTATPKEAILNGADYLVIGRAITNPQSMTSLNAVQKIKEEISKALQEKEKKLVINISSY